MPALIIHAGAGDHPPASDTATRAALATAAAAGWAVLAAGGAAVDAAVAAVAALEAAPGVNAGPGGALTAGGDAECDACVVDGDGAVGAVGAAAGLGSPVAVAAALAAASRRAIPGGLVAPDFLAGDGARAWAVAAGVPGCAPDAETARVWGATDEAKSAWREFRGMVVDASPHDTCGAAALDAAGRSAAACSSGGAPLRPPGRVGAAALVGAGAAARDGRARGATAAVAAAATGVGPAVARARAAAAAADALASPAAASGVLACVRAACADRGPQEGAPDPAVGVVAVCARAGGRRAELVAAHGAAALAFATATAVGGIKVHILRRDLGGDVAAWGAVVDL
jgi:isoaspartyl peptidase/L-asparaginase-like protein (Ntn-hydrolase superfamily)